jgi:uncharacterized protein (DUF1330 family)
LCIYSARKRRRKMAIYPTPEQIKELMKGPQDTPVVMLNLLTFKKMAAGSDGGDSGEEAYMRYAREMRKFVESRGGRFIWTGRVDSMVIGETDEEFHVAGLVEYPSRKAFLAIGGDPHVTENIGKHREAGLESQWLVAMTETPL